jgi:hypothetical protein
MVIKSCPSLLKMDFSFEGLSTKTVPCERKNYDCDEPIAVHAFKK